MRYLAFLPLLILVAVNSMLAPVMMRQLGAVWLVGCGISGFVVMALCWLLFAAITKEGGSP